MYVHMQVPGNCTYDRYALRVFAVVAADEGENSDPLPQRVDVFCVFCSTRGVSASLSRSWWRTAGPHRVGLFHIFLLVFVTHFFLLSF